MDTIASIFIAYFIFLWLLVELRSGIASIIYPRRYKVETVRRKDDGVEYWFVIIVKVAAIYLILRYTDFKELKNFSSESLQLIVMIFLLFSIGHIAYLVFSAKKK